MIGTGIGLLVAGLASGAATGVAAKIGSNAANHAGDLNAKAATDQLAYLQQKDAQDQRNWEATTAENRRQFDTTQALNLDQYNKKEARLGSYRSIGAGATGTLADLMGIRMVPQPGGASLPPAAAPSASGASTGTGAAPGGDAAALKAMLDGGLAPQEAVARFNQQFGRTTGNEAQYYDPSQHGGVATIGLPDAYLAKPGASWDITTRAGGGAPAAAAASGLSKPFTVMPGSTAPDLSSLFVRTAPLSALGV